MVNREFAVAWVGVEANGADAILLGAHPLEAVQGQAVFPKNLHAVISLTCVKWDFLVVLVPFSFLTGFAMVLQTIQRPRR